MTMQVRDFSALEMAHSGTSTRSASWTTGPKPRRFAPAHPQVGGRLMTVNLADYVEADVLPTLRAVHRRVREMTLSQAACP